jgi:hypothetical protein
MNKTSSHCIKRISEYDSNVSNGYIKCFITNITNITNIKKLNNAEVMTTLEFKPNYNNFIVKTITVLDKNQNNNQNKNNNKYQSLTNKIFHNINSIKTL